VVLGDPDMVADIIPVDFVVNDTLAAAWDICTGPASFRIYNSASSRLNPITFQEIGKYVQDFAAVSPASKALFT